MEIRDKIAKLWDYYSSETKKCISDLKTPGLRKKQIPNILTSSRIFAPFFIIPLSFFGLSEVAIALTCVAASTDFFDGFLARKLDARSEFGKELDPVSDKVFASGILICLSSINPLILVNLGLEIAIASTNFISKLKDNNPKTHILGKVKTWSLSLLMILSFVSMYVPINNVINLSLFGITTTLQIGSAVKYMFEDHKKQVLKSNANVVTQENNNEEKIDDKKINDKKKLLTNELKAYRNMLENSNKNIEDYKKNLRL